MSIDDDFYDIDAHINETEATTDWDILKTWNRFSTCFSELETDNDNLRKQNKELRIAIRVMMNIKEEKE